MAQYGRPDGDSAVGGWDPTEGTDLYDELDETTPDDFSSIVESFLLADETDSFRVTLSNVTDPETGANHKLKIRHRVEPEIGTNGVTWYLTLKEGTTTIASWNWTQADTGSWVTTTKTLSTAQADSIGDYTNLLVEVECLADDSNTEEVNVVVTWIEFEVPDAPTVPALSVYDGAAWKTATDVWVYNGSAWKKATDVWAYDGSSWRKAN